MMKQSKGRKDNTGIKHGCTILHARSFVTYSSTIFSLSSSERLSNSAGPSTGNSSLTNGSSLKYTFIYFMFLSENSVFGGEIFNIFE